MNTRLVLLSIVVTTSVLSSTGCDRLRALFGGKSSTTPGTSVEVSGGGAQGANTNVVAECPNETNTLEGVCKGEWKIVKGEDLDMCQFEFGPAVYCPEGSSPMNQSAACTGGYAKRFRPEHNIHSPADCAANYTKNLPPAEYKLTCCPMK